MLTQAVQLAKKTIPRRHRWLLRARRRHGSWFLRTPDRRLLEGKIIPYFAGLRGVRRVLDIGCDWYTAGYPRLFPTQQYCSIDIDPEKAHFARGEHRVASLLELDQHMEAASVDLVIANGVFGWGVDGRADISLAMRQIERVLRADGCVVVGWNDTDERRPDPLAEILEAPGFAPFAIPNIKAASVVTDTAYRHTYHFFKKIG